MPPTGYPMTLLPGSGHPAPRSPSRTSVRSRPCWWPAARAVGLVGPLRPRVVVAVGGYASVAVGLAAVLWRVPIVVAEQNQAPGLANRLLARFAKASAVSFPGTPLPRAVVTGNPIRDEISALDPARDRAAAKRAFGVDDRPAPPPRRRWLAGRADGSTRPCSAPCPTGGTGLT